MSCAIRITSKKAPDKYDLGASKFFGTPTIPGTWLEDFDDDEIFFCQIRLSEIAAFDRGNNLPHIGYLYIFLHTEGGKRRFRADVRYYDGEPDTALEDFNEAVDGYEQYNEAWLIEFSETDENEDCTRLFGVPSDWCYADEPPKLLLQYDPLDNDMGFLDSLDGFVYLFLAENEKDLGAVTLWEEYT